MQTSLLSRTKKFAIDVWLFCNKLPTNREFNNYVNQLLRCSSSVGANYRASQRAKSNADLVEEEADESLFFLELIKEINTNPNLIDENGRLLKEGNEILSMVVASIKKAKNNNSH